MTLRSLFLMLVAACLLLAPHSALEAKKKSKRSKQPPLTILVSIDGFRASYMRKGNSPVLDALANTGLSGSLEPSFPSVTFPNHYAIVTGRRPDHNGIVANNFVDPRRPEETFRLGDQKLADDPFWWDEAEPIWVTAEKQGVRSATMFWPGSTAPIHGVLPSDWVAYDQSVPSDQRVAKVLDWLRRPEKERPHFVTLYFDVVDTAGHTFGPTAPETGEAIAQVDAAIGLLRDGLEELDLDANLIIVADHGMTDISPDRNVDLDQLVPRADYRIIYGGPFTAIAPAPGKEASVTAALTGRHGKMRCWPKAEVPAQYRYGTNARVAPIICLADFGWQISQGPKGRTELGAHGFDPGAPDMTAIFIAHGPAFPGPRMAAKVPNIQVYPLLARVIGIEPLPSDGMPEIEATEPPWVKDRIRKDWLPDKLYH